MPEVVTNEPGFVRPEAPFYAELRRLGRIWWWVNVYEYLPNVAAKGWSLDCANRWVAAYWVPGRRWATSKAYRQVAHRNNPRRLTGERFYVYAKNPAGGGSW